MLTRNSSQTIVGVQDNMNDLGMIQNHLRHISASAKLPGAHIEYLRKLKAEGVEPKVIYDIGAVDKSGR